MGMRNDGGQVFPIQYVSQNQSTGETVSHQAETGMTLRDYFIAHAPVKPQSWFRPVMPEKHSLPARPTDLTEDEKSEIAGVLDGLDVDEFEQPRVRAYAEAHANARAEIAAWHVEYDKQMLVQWPAAWADEMLKARA